MSIDTNFTEFRWKPLRSVKKRLYCRCFPENFPNCLRITFFTDTSGRLLLDIFIHLTTYFFLAMEWTNRNQAFYICKHDLSRLSSVMNIMSSPWWALHLENFTKQTTHRSSSLLMFFRIGVLKNFTNFTVCEMFRITFLYKSPPVAASWPSYCCIGRHIIILIKLVNIYI